jgi:hypothetical protein
MPKSVIASLKEWCPKKKARTDRVNSFPPILAKDSDWPRREPEPSPSHVVEKEWMPEISNAVVGPIARCTVIGISGRVVECRVLLPGIELPRVSFPTSVLKQKGIVLVGNRFHWIMRDGARVRASDIDGDVPQSDDYTAAENAEFDRLYKEFESDLAANGSDWPEVSGPSR